MKPARHLRSLASLTVSIFCVGLISQGANASRNCTCIFRADDMPKEIILGRIAVKDSDNTEDVWGACYDKYKNSRVVNSYSVGYRLRHIGGYCDTERKVPEGRPCFKVPCIPGPGDEYGNLCTYPVPPDQLCQ